MRNSKMKRMLSCIMAAMLCIAMALQTEIMQVYGDTFIQSPIMVSELVPNTTNVNTKDAYEYIELQNISNNSLNVDNYEIIYYTGTTENVWSINQGGIVLLPGETLVIWVKPSEIASLTETDFNNFYGTSLVMGENLATVQSTGMANSGERYVKLKTKSGYDLTVARYNDGSNGVLEDKGITYKYDNITAEESRLGYCATPVPGAVDVSQKPSNVYEFVNPSDLQVSLSTPSAIQAGEDFTLNISAQSSNLIHTVTVYSKFDEELSYTSADINQVVGQYAFMLPNALLSGHTSLDYYVTVNDGVFEQTTDVQTVSIISDIIPTPEPEVMPKSPIMISELVPNPPNVNTTDAYEYIELYNTSDKPLNMDNYELIYWAGSSSSETVWTIDQTGIVIPVGGTLVVWPRTAAVSNLTADEFNAYYGTSLVMGTDLATTSGALPNSAERYIKLKTKSGYDLVLARYSASTANKGITYSYSDLSAVEELQMSIDATPVPGVVDANQKPAKAYKFTEPSDFKISLSAPSAITTGESLTLDIAVQSSGLIHAVTTYTKYDEESYYISHNNKQTDGQYTFTLSDTSLIGHTSLDYYVTVSDGESEESTEVYTIQILGEDSSNIQPPELIITEIMPDSSNVNGLDGYEFVEVYNNSDHAVDFKDYKLFYDYSNKEGDSKGLIWDNTPDSFLILSGQAVVFWIRNGANNELTASDFNAKFGTSLTAGVNLFDTYGGSMANSGDRAIRLTTNVEDELDFVLYNQLGTDDTTADKSIKYQFKESNGHSLMLDNTAIPSPGTVTPEEAPAARTHISTNPSGPVLTDSTQATFDSSDDLVFELNAVAGPRTVKTVNLYLKDQTMSDFELYVLKRDNGDIFQKIVKPVDLTGKQHYDYYFEVSDGLKNVYTMPSETPSRTVSMQPEKDSLRLNLTDSQTVNDTQFIIASAEAGDLSLYVDNVDVTSQTFESLEPKVIFAADISQTDTFFKNAVSIGSDLVGTFTEGTYNYWGSIAYEIPVSYFSKGQPLKISVHAGNKANTLEHNDENADDYVIQNIRLILQDGRTLRAEGLEDPTKSIKMGDSAGKYEILDAIFNVDNISFTGIRYTWDTKNVGDGLHTLKVVSGTEEYEINVQVDNTAPVIATNLEEKIYKGVNEINASATDDISGVDKITAVLDGKDISLPYTFSSISLTAGIHTVTFTATDISGNMAIKTVKFTIPEENPIISALMPTKDFIAENIPVFSAIVSDITDDEMTVIFKKGESYEMGASNISPTYGVSMQSGAVLEQPTEGFGVLSEKNGYPYQQFDVELEDSINDSSILQMNWKGTTNEGSKLQMYVYNFKNSLWDKIATGFTQSSGEIELTGEIIAENHYENKVVKVMVQNGLGFTPTQYEEGTLALPTDNTNITTYNSNDLVRDNYDFTFALQSDTQYYNENYNDIYRHQLNIVDWIIGNRPRMNIQYIFHTGDIVDDMPEIQEWENVDAAYSLLDEEDIPYGVLAGNHDVDHEDENYSLYSDYFGESRFNTQPWYGESYKDNRGHYDLISVDGIDFIMVYMGWGIYEDEIDWMNEVLQKYPERIAILNFHEYLLVSGGIGEQIQDIYNEVVAVNTNVRMVLSGHYHNAALRIDKFDDDKDGINDRNVYAMLFDYQKLAEGGLGFIRLIHFDVDGETMYVRTYSPSLDQYNAGGDMEDKEDFYVPFSDLGIVPKNKTLSTENFHINVYADELLGKDEGVKSGETSSFRWADADNGVIGWYAEVIDQFGGLTRSDVQYLTVDMEYKTSDDDNDDDNNDNSNSDVSDGKNSEITIGQGNTPETFSDVPANEWYYKAVEFIAARGITTGTGNGKYSPEARLTRGEFLVMLMKAYALAPDASGADNFADAGNDYYTDYLAAAKRLGISNGVGNNMYAPKKEITRQEMFTLLYNALNVIDNLPQGNSKKSLSDFSDEGQIENWAKEAMSFMIKTGIVSGYDGKLTPAGNTTRAQMAQILYNLLSK